jgi:hypothetical protein
LLRDYLLSIGAESGGTLGAKHIVCYLAWIGGIPVTLHLIRVLEHMERVGADFGTGVFLELIYDAYVLLEYLPSGVTGAESANSFRTYLVIRRLDVAQNAIHIQSRALRMFVFLQSRLLHRMRFFYYISCTVANAKTRD